MMVDGQKNAAALGYAPLPEAVVAKEQQALGRVTTPVLLGLVFVAVLLPTRLVLALTGGDPLTRRFDRTLPSYWAERAHPGFSREGFERLW
jgi:hypothetical protein